MKAIQLIAGLAALALLAAGCGAAAKSPGVANLGSSTSASTSSTSSSVGSAGAAEGGAPGSQAVAYSACMRQHGVSNFPEPKITTHGNGVSVAIGINPSISGNPNFTSAQHACKKLLPEGGASEGSNHPISSQEQTQYLKAAACIRTHGIPSFPDPTFSGGNVHVSQKGLDLHSPQVRAAEEACQSLIPGGLHGNH